MQKHVICLDPNINVDDIYELLRLNTTTYLRETCSVEMPFNEETGKLKLNFTEINSLSKNSLQVKNQN